jgi:hypothetical protein
VCATTNRFFAILKYYQYIISHNTNIQIAQTPRPTISSPYPYRIAILNLPSHHSVLPYVRLCSAGIIPLRAILFYLMVCSIVSHASVLRSLVSWCTKSSRGVGFASSASGSSWKEGGKLNPAGRAALFKFVLN